MKVSFATNGSRAALASVAAILSRKPVMPVLGCVVLSAEKDALRMFGGNDVLTVSLSIPAVVQRPGVVALPGRRTAEILGHLSGEEVFLDAEGGGRISLVSGCSHYRLLSADPSEFPYKPHETDERGAVVALPQAELLDALSEVAPAVSERDDRPALRGVYFERKGAKLSLVATDGSRMAISSISVAAGDDASFILPDSVVQYLISNLSREGSVSIQASPRSAKVRIDTPKGGPLCGEVVITSKLIEGAYPPYRRAVPNDHPVSVVIAREALIEAIHRAALMTSDSNNSLNLSVEDSGIRIRATTPDLGEADELVPHVRAAGGGATGRFNPRFLMEAMQGLTHDEVKLLFGGPAAPLRVDSGGRFTGIVMPLKIT